MLIGSHLKALGPLIREICVISGTPGVSLGVLHNGEVVHQANYGFRDLDAGLPPNENTTFLIGSLTKAFTSAMVGMLVDDGKLNWTTQLHEVIPEFKRGEKDPASNITITDLLSHRTGLPSYDSLWLSSNNYIPLNRSQAVPILSYVPVAKPLRTDFLYNNMAYEVAGQVIEKLSGTTYADFLRDRLLNPLQLDRTFYTDVPLDENAAKAYVNLDDGSPVEIPTPVHGKDVLIGPAGGIRSCVKDLLVLYKKFMEAANSQFEHSSSSSPGNPLKQLRHLWRGMVDMSFGSLRENSYALGWMRAELPGVMSFGASYTPPILGHGLPSRLMLHHQGQISGAVAYVSLFPETSSAVIALANSATLNDAIRLIGQLLVEALFNNSINTTEYREKARAIAVSGASYMSYVQKKLLHGITVAKPAYTLQSYTGRYYNSIGNYFIDITERSDGIRVSFMGLEADSFDLEPYQHNSFFWKMTHNECVKLSRFPTFPEDYYIIKFGCQNSNGMGDPNENVHMNCLIWKHEFSLPGDGEVFKKSTSGRRYVRHGSQQSVRCGELRRK